MRLGELLRGTTPALYASDLQRAVQTAEPVGRMLRVDVVATPELRELDNGVARGLSLADAARIERPVTEPVLDWVPYEGAESWRDLHGRIAAFFTAIDTSLDGTVLVVTHGNALICAVNWFLRIDSDELLARTRYDADPGSITQLRVELDGCRTLVRSNDTSHLQ